MTLYGGIETGGTTTACIIGSWPDNIVAESRFATTTPTETIRRIVGFFVENARTNPVAAVGVGSFGPVDLDQQSPTYGFITTTPKPGWQQVDLCGPVGAALGVPVILDTDVNAAALGEWIATDRDAEPLLYLTVGTGIGLGAVVNGKPVHGLIHPEAGHMLLPHDRTLDPFAGACPFHGDCWEGLASGAALEQRWGARGEALPPDHPAWDLEARYLGSGIANLIYCFSPRRVVVGGGVMLQAGLLDRVRIETRKAISGYLQSDLTAQHIDQLVVPPRLGARAGVLGALALSLPA
jgi:fructokinase